MSIPFVGDSAGGAAAIFSLEFLHLCDMNQMSQQYIWVDCRRSGWQALVADLSLCRSVSEPPSCVLDAADNSVMGRSSPTQKKQPGTSISRCHVKSSSTARIASPLRSIGTIKERVTDIGESTEHKSDSWEASLNQYPQSFARGNPVARDIISENKIMHSPTMRSKRNLLNEASKQLQASESIGNSLAERLVQLQSELNSS